MHQRFACSALILMAVLSGVVHAAEMTESAVEQRLKALEAKVVDLERRLEMKESAAAVAPAPVATPVVAAASSPASRVAAPAASAAPAAVESPPSQAPAQWHALKRGMSWSQVIGVLGKPGKKRVSTMSETWFYPDSDGGSVEFDRDGRVSAWGEP